MDSFTDLVAWRTGVDLAKAVYVLTKKFPKDEQFGMTSQIRRSSVSILANIAEGFGRFTYPDTANKYTIARGEAAETKAILLLSVELGFVTSADIHNSLRHVDEVGRLLSGLIAACKRRS